MRGFQTRVIKAFNLEFDAGIKRKGSQDASWILAKTVSKKQTISGTEVEPRQLIEEFPMLSRIYN